MKIERAVREKTFTLTSIAGPSGSGKTYSAILYARGLVGPNGKIGFVDTENKRSRFYADVAGGFDVIDLDPPFTSARYIEAIKTFEDAGYKAIIIDSISHEWEGTGGVLEQADAIEQATKRAGLHCWAKPKAGHKKMMNEVLQTSAHLIFCCRVKEKVVQVKGANGKTEIVNEGFVVVQEKMFIYEMTVSMMLEEGSHVPTIQKCPGDLEAAFPAGKKITPDVGKSVAQWADQGVAIDQELETAKREGLLAANNGMRALLEWWKALGPRQAKLEGMKDTFKSIATAADQLKADINEAGGGSLRDSLAQARAQEGADTREGFDQSFVTRETAALTGEADSTQTEDNSQSSDTSTDEGSADVTPSSVGDPAADNSDAGNDGVDEGAGDIGAADGQSASSAPDLSDEDRAWLLSVAKQLWAATGVGEQDLVSGVAGDLRNGAPETISGAARAKAVSIVKQCKLVCYGEQDAADTLELIAGIVGVETKDIV
ncbi:MAG: AAA family ATPase [Mesorhizobium sp.]